MQTRRSAVASGQSDNSVTPLLPRICSRMPTGCFGFLRMGGGEGGQSNPPVTSQCSGPLPLLTRALLMTSSRSKAGRLGRALWSRLLPAIPGQAGAVLDAVLADQCKHLHHFARGPPWRQPLHHAWWARVDVHRLPAHVLGSCAVGSCIHHGQ